MAITPFGRGRDAEFESTPGASPARPSSSAPGGLTAFIDQGSEFEGKLSFRDTVRIDGRFRGEITSENTLIVGESGEIEADIRKAIEPQLKAMPARAKFLEQCRDKRNGRMLPGDYWSNIALIGRWKGGTVGANVDKFPDLFNPDGRRDIPVRDWGYLSSEARCSIPLTDEGCAAFASARSAAGRCRRTQVSGAVRGSPASEEAQEAAARAVRSVALRTSSARANGVRAQNGVPTSASDGASPGVSTNARQPAGAAGTTPARSSEVLPMPEGPITASRRRELILRHSAATSASRPKKNSESASVNGARPG